jgi:Arc/MetJ-type ribon-helix-helix transcriptional regulator
MATTKITITLPDEQIDAIRELVAAGKANSLSGFVKHAVAVGLFDAAGWRTTLDDALRETGGALTNEERIWADGLLQQSKEPVRRKGPSDRATGKNRAA